MTWLQTLQQWDSLLFQLINNGMSNPLFDAVLPYFREKWFWTPLYLFVAAFALQNFRKKGLAMVVGLAVVVGMADITSSQLVKKNVHRLRPCNDPALNESVMLRVSCGSGYSFTSSHAANHFAVAIFLTGLFGGLARWVRPVALCWATVVSFSQVYVGVHYPGDVFFGALLGTAIAWLGLLTINRFRLNSKC